MSSLRDIRKRIKTANSTKKITKAMKMVAASKFRRYHEQVQHARPYYNKFNQFMVNLIESFQTSSVNNELLRKRKKIKKIALLVLTSDRGLCGGFNSNVIKKCRNYIYDNEDNFEKIYISTIGKKGNDALKKLKISIYSNYTNILDKPTFAQSKEIVTEICNKYINHDLDAVLLIYNKFKSAISQSVVIDQMMPISSLSVKNKLFNFDYIYEQNIKNFLNFVIPKYFTTKFFQAVLESITSENGARMTAMDNAVRNAEDMISKLTVTYNRVRQAVITKELMEIISGAEAL